MVSQYIQPCIELDQGAESTKQEIDRMLGTFESAQPEWASLIVLMPMKDGTLHFSVDYSKFKAMAICDAYMILPKDNYIDALAEPKILFPSNSNGGYWQVKITEKDRYQTAFESHHGLFFWKGIPWN